VGLLFVFAATLSHSTFSLAGESKTLVRQTVKLKMFFPRTTITIELHGALDCFGRDDAICCHAYRGGVYPNSDIVYYKVLSRA
jgi:hypothetical protein